MRYCILKFILFLIFIFSYSNFSFSENEKKVTAVELIHSSENSLKNLISNSVLANLTEYLKNSRAILIFPELYEGGLLFGAKGGNGILIIRRTPEEFSGPFFYSIGGLSLGLQVGVKSAQVAMTIMTNRGLNSILKERGDDNAASFSLGASQYYMEDNVSALKSFEQALSSKDRMLQSKALYNIARILQDQNELDKSLSLYKKSLELNPNDIDSKINYELLKRMINQQDSQNQQNDQNQEGSEDQQNDKNQESS